MIPKNYILEWSNVVPWVNLQQVEQDLLITTSLLYLYNNPILKDGFAFRGGTALNKLIFTPALRYSEDIDLVQVKPGPIGEHISLIRKILLPLLGDAVNVDRSEGGATLRYKITSEEGFVFRLKIEINPREHFFVLGPKEYVFTSTSSWFPGTTIITSYFVEELLGTKLRALYQRRKGRDLYDLYIALTTIPELDTNNVLRSFLGYMKHEKLIVTQSLFIKNIELKLKNMEFRGDMAPLLPRHAEPFDPDEAYRIVRIRLLEKLP